VLMRLLLLFSLWDTLEQAWGASEDLCPTSSPLHRSDDEPPNKNKEVPEFECSSSPPVSASQPRPMPPTYTAAITRQNPVSSIDQYPPMAVTPSHRTVSYRQQCEISTRIEPSNGHGHGRGHDQGHGKSVDSSSKVICEPPTPPSTGLPPSYPLGSGVRVGAIYDLVSPEQCDSTVELCKGRGTSPSLSQLNHSVEGVVREHPVGRDQGQKSGPTSVTDEVALPTCLDNSLPSYDSGTERTGRQSEERCGRRAVAVYPGAGLACGAAKINGQGGVSNELEGDISTLRQLCAASLLPHREGEGSGSRAAKIYGEAVGKNLRLRRLRTFLQPPSGTAMEGFNAEHVSA